MNKQNRREKEKEVPDNENTDEKGKDAEEGTVRRYGYNPQRT